MESVLLGLYNFCSVGLRVVHYWYFTHALIRETALKM